MFSEEKLNLLKQAFVLYNQEYRKTLPSEEELKSITFSAKFDRRMQMLIKRRKKFYYPMINTAGKRVASIIVIILACLTITTFSVEAIREPVINFIITTYERFTNIIFGYDKPEGNVTFNKIDPEYLPDGFITTVLVDEGSIYHVNYNNEGDGEVVYYMQTINDGASTNVNTEGVEYTKIKVNRWDGIKYSNLGFTTVVFSNETYIFTISGNISEYEIIKIAESIPIE